MAIYNVASNDDLFKYVNGFNDGPRAVVGDKVYIASGTYECRQSGVLNFNYGVEYIGAGINRTIIRSISNHGSPNVIATGKLSDWINNTTLLSGITFDLRNSAGQASPYANFLFAAVDSRVVLKDVFMFGPGSGTDKNLMTAICNSGTRCFLDVYNSTLCSGGGDLFGTYGYIDGNTREHADAQLSQVSFYNCLIHSAGQDGFPATNNQIITGHQGFPVRLHGCELYNGWIDGPTAITMEYCIHEPYTIIGSGISIQENGGFSVQVGNIIRHARNEMSNNDGSAYYTSAGQRKPRSQVLFKNNVVEKLSQNNIFLVQESSGTGSNLFTQTDMMIVGNHFRQAPGAGGGAEAYIQLTTPASGSPNINIYWNQFNRGARIIRFAHSNSGDYNGFGGSNIALYHNTCFNVGGQFSYRAIRANNYNLRTTLINNIFASGSNLFDDASGAPAFTANVYGIVEAYGNIMTSAMQTGWPGISGTANNNYFSATPQWTFDTYRTPLTGGNLDYGGSGVSIISVKFNDIGRKVPLITDYVGAFSRPVMTGIIVPTQY